eukprot:CAMPEP_0115220020 /NCGR_PEP_ID=MMETSP0270-20121206/27229_1 /TAXON_ID=71861 /ORGANISM="Scrippsiella trochoidea, Strain CCMP3099" /LENGTH=605 /DNA_ID=CAMNT_0002634057 /DNA_START=28 /DNA_END=1845 /DNA_ORIENTATION=+
MAALLPVALAEEEKAPKVDIAIAVTLIGAVSFQMGLMYLTNHHDKDMRKYTYQVINQTVSIFCSVLMFQTFNDILEAKVLKGASPEWKFCINWLHMFFWFLILQVTLAKVCGAIGKEPEDKEEVEQHAKSAGTLLAHMTGFASINAWGSIQQLEFFRSSPGASFLVLPISFGGQFVLQRFTDWLRDKVSNLDDKVTEFEHMWDEETEEAENDIMGLTISFNLAQAIRFANSDFLPDTEGVEPMDVLGFHTDDQIYRLWMIALMFAIFMGIMNFIQAPEDPEASKDAHHKALEAGSGDLNQGLLENHGHNEHAQEHEHHHDFWTSVKERSWEVTMLAWSMSFAWCCFFSAKMTLARVGILQDLMILSVVLTLTISLVSFSCIRLLDLLADAEWTGARVDHTIFQIIRAIGLIVGFAWEQTFDQAVESLSSALAWPHMGKFLLAVFCVLVIVPAWYKYILPFAITNQWEFGFIVHDLDSEVEQERLQKVVEHVKEKKAAKDKKREKKQDEGSHPPHVQSRLTSAVLEMDMHLGSQDESKEELRVQKQQLQDKLNQAIEMLKTREKAERQREQDLQADSVLMDKLHAVLMREARDIVKAGEGTTQAVE